MKIVKIIWFSAESTTKRDFTTLSYMSNWPALNQNGIEDALTVLIQNSLEQNLTAPVPAATTAAQPIHLNTMDIPNDFPQQWNTIWAKQTLHDPL